MNPGYSYSRIFSFFKQFWAPYWDKFLLATVLSIISSSLSLYAAYAVAKALNLVIAYKIGDPLNDFYFVIISWALSILLQHTANFYCKYIGLSTAEIAGKDAEVFAINHLSAIDIAWHEKENSGNKLKKIDRAAQNIIDGTRMWLSSIIDLTVKVVGALIIIGHFDKTLSGLIFVYLVIYFTIARLTRVRASKAQKEINIKDEEITGLFFEIVSNIRTIKVLGMAKKILGLAKIETEKYAGLARNRVFWFQGGYFLRGIWEGVGRISLFIFVIWNIVNGHYAAGFLVLFYSYFNSLTNAMGTLSDVAQDLVNYKNNIGRLTDMLDEPITIDNENGKIDFPKDWTNITMKNLSFKYGKNKVLNKINLTIEKGQKVGIIGLSGAGKSTLFKLLLKEHEDFTGSILIGKTPIQQIKKFSYAIHTAAVLQETEVFNMSLKENIVLANSKEERNDKLFRKALATAHVDDFLKKLPDGVKTLIGEKGVKLSGGERQRLGLARAVFKSPEILFLDEATSHLDIESEQKIQDSLQKFFKDVTAVVIAHRLSTIKEMDKIVILENGAITESGSFDELYEKGGRFRELWDKQSL